ncbi:MAG: hypothetical protein MUE67_03885 [Anaerolineales bacterium]|nr:hypothetical protein [Anaerolineales bacterium]
METLSKVILAWIAAALVTAALALAWSGVLRSELRAQLILGSSLVILLGLALIYYLEVLKKKIRLQTWRLTLEDWQSRIREKQAPEYQMAGQLSAGALKNLAGQVFQRLGYRGLANEHPEDPNEALLLINPAGELEVVRCWQSQEPAGLEQVSQLNVLLNRVGAVRGYLWSPSGFSSACVYHTRGKAILLADELDIGRLVDCTTEHQPKTSPKKSGLAG